MIVCIYARLDRPPVADIGPVHQVDHPAADSRNLCPEDIGFHTAAAAGKAVVRPAAGRSSHAEVAAEDSRAGHPVGRRNIHLGCSGRILDHSLGRAVDNYRTGPVDRRTDPGLGRIDRRIGRLAADRCRLGMEDSRSYLMSRMYTTEFVK